MCLRVEDTWYFLVTVLDAYSRYVVHWELLTTMTAAAVRMVLQDALEKTGANPEIVTDNVPTAESSLVFWQAKPSGSCAAGTGKGVSNRPGRVSKGGGLPQLREFCFP